MTTVTQVGYVQGPSEGTNVTSHTIVMGTVANGDTMILVVGLASGTTVSVNGGPFSAATADFIETARSGVGAHMWVTPVLAAQSGSTLTITTGTSLKVAANLVVLRGLDATTPIVSFVDSTGTTSTTQTGPTSITAATGQILITSLHVGSGSSAPPTTFTPPSGETLVTSRGTAGTTGRAGSAIAVNLTDNQTVSTGWSTDTAAAYVVVQAALALASTSADVTVTPSAATGTGLAPSPVVSTTWSRPEDALSTDAPTVATALGSTTPIAGATLIAPEDTSIVKRGAGAFTRGASFPDTTTTQPASRYPYGYGNPTCWAWETVVTGTKLAFLFKWLTGTNQGRWRLTVDGKRVTDGFQTLAGTTGGSMHTTLLTWGTSATRRILVEFNGVPFGGLYTDGSTAPVPTYTNRAIFQGDSITQGSDYNTAAGAGTWFARFGKYMGYDDPWNIAIGSTGYTADGTSIRLTDTTRVSDVTTYAQFNGDVFVWAGGNDGGTSIASAATTYFTGLMSSLPSARIIVVGTWNPSWPTNSSRAARDAELDTVASTLGLAFISPITGKVRTAAGTLLATKAPIIGSTADVTAYVNTTDNVHPNDAGHKQIANWMAEAMQLIGQNVFVAAAPATGSGVAPAPAVTAARLATVTTTPATGTGVAPAPAVTTTRFVTVTVTKATGTGLAPAPTVTAARFATITTTPATGTGSAPSPVVTTTRAVTVIATVATGTGTAPAPTVVVSGSASVNAPASVGSAVAPAPTVTTTRAATITVTKATGTAAAPAPVVTASGTVTITPPAATATGLAPAPIISTTINATILVLVATATGMFRAPTVTTGAISRNITTSGVTSTRATGGTLVRDRVSATSSTRTEGMTRVD